MQLCKTRFYYSIYEDDILTDAAALYGQRDPHELKSLALNLSVDLLAGSCLTSSVLSFTACKISMACKSVTDQIYS